MSELIHWRPWHMIIEYEGAEPKPVPGSVIVGCEEHVDEVRWTYDHGEVTCPLCMKRMRNTITTLDIKHNPLLREKKRSLRIQNA